MAGGKIAYIKRRLAELEDRSKWLRTAVKRPDVKEWWVEELADYDRRIEHYQQQLNGAEP